MACYTDKLVKKECLYSVIHGGIYMKIQGTDAAVNIRINSGQLGTAGRTADAEQIKIGPGRSQQQKSTEVSDYPINEKVVSEAVEKINRALEGTNRIFQYTIHEGTKDIMIKVIDETTKEVIKEIPPKKILDMIASMMEMAGLLVDERR